MKISLQQLALKVAEKVREIATRQGTVPFRTGDLRKSHVVQPLGVDRAMVGSNLPYARAVHDGRPRLVIRPKFKKALAWKGGPGPRKKVVQPARQGNPWLLGAVETLAREGVMFLARDVGEAVAIELTEALRAQGFNVRRKKP